MDREEVKSTNIYMTNKNIPFFLGLLVCIFFCSTCVYFGFWLALVQVQRDISSIVI